ncbi:MAG: threonine/serine dehydratase [Gemmatimonadota bacterium]|nr:MAG: threonine/serine dehydratase [Gemmatimonadota bacterium]
MGEPVKSIDVEAARDAIGRIAVETPIISSPVLDERTGGHVWLKLESLQVTGSFKVRGAANKILSLTKAERERGVVTCSSGNHGRAVAYVADILDIPAVVCVPEWVDPTKLAAIRRHRAETVLHGKTYDEAEARSFELQRERGLVYVHPFDEPHVIAGQGTIGLELLEQLPLLDTAVVPLSGGGLIAGIALALKRTEPEYRVIGVSAANAAVMYESLEAGKPIACPEEETIASALSGGIGLDNQYTFELVRDLVDDYVLVSEDEIREAMAFAATEHKLVVEGGGAVGIAALLSREVEVKGENVAVVVSGGNIEASVLAEIIAGTSAAD